MRIATGKVVAGKVVIEGSPFEEGATVTVIAPDDAGTFELGPDDETELLKAISEADRGDVVPAVDLLSDLTKRG